MTQDYFLTVLGLICFFEGLPYLASPELLKQWMIKVSTMESKHLRMLGAALMLLGLFLVYWGRHHGG
jgi:uncharacterized protein